MLGEQWSSQHLTDSAKRILRQIPERAGDRGLHVVDQSSIVMMVLWSLLHWERKVGRCALEHIGVDPYELARHLDRLLQDKAEEHPVAVTPAGTLVLVKTREAYTPWDVEALLEPLLQQAEHEALALGHTYVGSEHLVLAVIRLADAALAGLLREYLVVHARVKEAVVELLGP